MNANELVKRVRPHEEFIKMLYASCQKDYLRIFWCIMLLRYTSDLIYRGLTLKRNLKKQKNFHRNKQKERYNNACIFHGSMLKYALR